MLLLVTLILLEFWKEKWEHICFCVLVTEAQLESLVSKVATSDRDAENYKREVNALFKELDTCKPKQPTIGDKLDEMPQPITGNFIKKQTNLKQELALLSLDKSPLFIILISTTITPFSVIIWSPLNVSILCSQALRRWRSPLAWPLQETLDHSLLKLHSSTEESSQTLAGLTTPRQVCLPATSC